MPVEPLPNPDLSEYFRNSVDLLSVYEVGGKVGLTNPSWQRVLGWSPEDLEGKDFIDFVHARRRRTHHRRERRGVGRIIVNARGIREPTPLS